MKILIVGQNRQWALERHYRHYLAKWATVDLYDLEDRFDDFYQRSLFNKVLHRLGLTAIYRHLSKDLLARVEAFRPDVVLVFKGMSLLPEAIEKMRVRGIFVANYNPDHPFVFSSRGSGNSNVSRSIGLYDLHLSYHRQVLEKIKKEYGLPTALLPFGFELPEGDFEAISSSTEILRVCFIGNPDPLREAVVRKVAEAGLPIAVYGHGWQERLPSLPGLKVHDAVYGRNYWRLLRQYRVQLNIFRPHNAGAHNMRSFEVPAAGGIMLAPDSPDHREYFAEGKEIFLYRSLEELPAKAAALLELSADRAAAIRQQARQRSLNPGYDYKSRALQLYECLEAHWQARTPALSRTPN